jgi:hypothetical protein
MVTVFDQIQHSFLQNHCHLASHKPEPLEEKMVKRKQETNSQKKENLDIRSLCQDVPFLRSNRCFPLLTQQRQRVGTSALVVGQSLFHGIQHDLPADPTIFRRADHWLSIVIIWVESVLLDQIFTTKKSMAAVRVARTKRR